MSLTCRVEIVYVQSRYNRGKITVQNMSFLSSRNWYLSKCLKWGGGLRFCMCVQVVLKTYYI